MYSIFSDGGWSDWGSWGKCTVTCGSGLKRRHRLCDNPVPSAFGRGCEGNQEETNLCTSQSCVSNSYNTLSEGHWSNWGTWSSCSVTCGIGLLHRHRSCNSTSSSENGHNCLGESHDVDICIVAACDRNITNGDWSDWSPWDDCSMTCGTGLKHRHRACSNPAPSENGQACIGNSFEVDLCLRLACVATTILEPLDGGWSVWTSWGHCSVTCGTGLKQRKRFCDNPEPSIDGKHCIGDVTDIDLCTDASCNTSTDGGWSDWGDWGICYVTCGTGLKHRYRTCDNPVPSGSGTNCLGNVNEVDLCNSRPCFNNTNGGWSVWSSWGSCSVSCGMGLQHRHRLCNNPIPAGEGKICPGDTGEVTLCNEGPCSDDDTRDGGWSEWVSWGDCSVTCGTGIIHRQRTCDTPVPSGAGKTCTGNSNEVDICLLNACLTPVATYDLWSDWGECSVTCGTGIKRRHRLCNNDESSTSDHICIGNFQEEIPCNTTCNCEYSVCEFHICF